MGNQRSSLVLVASEESRLEPVERERRRASLWGRHPSVLRFAPKGKERTRSESIDGVRGGIRSPVGR